jgi:hydrogenase maturation factor HypF (carbamoyltransferase family)
MTEQEIKAIFGEDTVIIRIDPGNVVLCDLCNEDYTNSDEKGGLLFSSKAVCPHCLPDFMKRIKKHNEQKFIRAVAKPEESFRDFVYRIR